MESLDLKQIVNCNGKTLLISTVNLILKRSDEKNYQTIIVESKEFQKDTMSLYDINYDIIDWDNVKETYNYDTCEDAMNNHYKLVREYKNNGVCGVR